MWFCFFFFKATILRWTINIMQFTCVVTRFHKHAVCKARNEVPRGWIWKDLTAVLKLTRCEVSRNCCHYFSIPKNPFVLNGHFSVRSKACWKNINSQYLTLFEEGFFFFFLAGGDLEYLLMVILICLSNKGCPDTHSLQGPVGLYILCCSCSGNERLKAACHLKRWQLFKVLECSPPLNLLRHSEPSTRNSRSELDSLFAELA